MKPVRDYDLICIGSGPAGQRAAVQAAKLRKRVAVIEKQAFAGGHCVESGTIPSKTFREAVRRVYSRPGLEQSTSRRTKVRPKMRIPCASSQMVRSATSRLTIS